MSFKYSIIRALDSLSFWLLILLGIVVFGFLGMAVCVYLRVDVSYYGGTILLAYAVPFVIYFVAFTGWQIVRKFI